LWDAESEWLDETRPASASVMRHLLLKGSAPLYHQLLSSISSWKVQNDINENGKALPRKWLTMKPALP
jgi:hypothetical protein